MKDIVAAQGQLHLVGYEQKNCHADGREGLDVL
jgi:hypothetical protein